MFVYRCTGVFWYQCVCQVYLVTVFVGVFTIDDCLIDCIVINRLSISGNPDGYPMISVHNKEEV